MKVLFGRGMIGMSVIGATLFAPVAGAEVTEAAVSEAFEQGRYKDAIAGYQELASKASKEEKGQYLIKLALTYHHDQSQDKAFATFLAALDAAPRKTPPVLSAAEKELCDEGFKIYLGQGGTLSQEASIQLRQKYASVVEMHPDYYQLNYLVAAAYANLGIFDEFFEAFYQSYVYYPESFFAYKTKAVLHLKLFERARSSEEREKERVAILSNIDKALAKEPSDTGLYTLMMVLAPDGGRGAVVKKVITSLLEHNIKVPRRDIGMYVQEAVSNQEFELAQRFVDKARDWYAYSRSLAEAQEFIDSKRK